MGAVLKFFYKLGKELGERLFGKDEEKLPAVEKKECNAKNAEVQD